MIDLLVIEETLNVSRNEWGLRLIGEVRNGSDLTAGTSVIEIAVLDESGHLVKTATGTAVGIQPETHFLSNTWHILPAGETGWFNVHLYVPEDVEIGEILIDARSYETDLVAATVPLEMVGDWQIGDDGYLTATIRNTGALDLVGVSARLAIRLADGTMLDTTAAAHRGERIGGYLGGLRGGEEAEITTYIGFDPETLVTAEIETRLAGRVYEGSRQRYGIVGVAHRTGLDGSFWRSSLSLTNRSGAVGNVTLSFRQAASRIDVDVEIPDETSLFWTDVTRTLFGIEGSAAGYIQIDSDVPLSITARTFNSTSMGDFGQALPVYTQAETTSLRFADAGVLSLVRGVQQFRTNVGLVNMSDETCRAGVRLFSPNGNQLVDLGNVRLEPTSWRQLNDVIPEDADAAYATIEILDGCSIWAYASVIEEPSGDPTTIEVAPEVELWLSGSTRPAGGIAMGGGWAD